MPQLQVFIGIFLHLFCGLWCQNSQFDDSMLYDISWAGPLRSKQAEKENPVLITTKDNEQYSCSLPKLREDLMDEYSPGPGPSPEEMLKPLTGNTRCSYRLDTYWTYELCHGSHVRQFHDEKPMKSQVVQEYMLGKVATVEKKDGEKLKEEATESKKTNVEKKEDEPQGQVLPPKRNLNGREVPYYEVTMDNGTPCELLQGKPRKSRILYMCKPDSNNEIISVKEVQSCEYQLEVLTPFLCASDMYNVKEDQIHPIRCHSLNGSPREPQSYIYHVEESEADRLGFREYQYMPVQDEGSTDASKSSEHRKIPPQPDQQLTQDFLNGVYCLRGGSGWWHYEYCHGVHVLQYHTDQQGKTIIYLGHWNIDVHRDWVKKNPQKSMEYVTHYYGNGEICDITGMARTVQVRLKCMKSNHLQEVSIYLLEPKKCQYILGVDSPILCPLIEKADEDGIFPTKL
ncbi:endoplasmic reticulum lectin 1-like [Dendronephthya gigantea]|uniref:endoplasmic reticulum lectin 1-like n=1 Tax=Dendronephthya gigantea TaxID=151771 RepID=UPI00106DA9C5|nr:endoplasmic reticulum lectin 1-like [Dendronephthya gigantea]